MFEKKRGKLSIIIMIIIILKTTTTNTQKAIDKNSFEPFFL